MITCIIIQNLGGKIKEVFGTQEAFSQAMGISSSTLSDKLNNKVEWSQTEIMKTSKLIYIAKKDIPAYFFNDIVQENEPTNNVKEVM